IVLPSVDAPAGEALLMMPAVYINIETAAKTMTDFEARDAAGILPMETKDDPAEGPVYYRKWIPTRPVKGDLFVRYRAPIDPRPQTRSEVPIVLRSEDGGFHGGGTFFILSPATPSRYGLQIHWDLDALGPQARGISSLGDNDIEVAEAGAADQLTSVFFMAGPLSRYPANPAPGGFSAAWLTRPPFDPLPLMAWAEKLYNSYRSFFKTEGKKPYRVFLRTNRVNAGGGIGLVNSFVATFDDKTKAEDLKLLLAHEMFHTFAPSLEKESEHGMGSTQWFTEGLAVYYQRLLPLRAGLIGPAVFLEDLNLTAGRYYTNLLNGTANDQIAPRFWEDTRIRVLPYDRGSMYLAVVDSKIRKASGGKRSLDDLLLTLLNRQIKGSAVGPETWVELVTAELGPSAKEEYEAMLAGAVMVPASDAFGPEYERTVAPLRRFELGFDPKVMLERPSIVHGLVSGSEAERAGLRNGDEILLVSAGLDGVQEDQKRLLALKIRREGKDFSIMYLPRGETVNAYQWVRVTGPAAGQIPAAPDRAPIVSVTEHTGTFNGRQIKYSAMVAETFIPGKDGKPAASMVTTTYLRKDVENAAARPVLFGFNGGPGASSTPLHLSALGPRRWKEVDGERTMDDNPFSPIADIDLVFIDPIGTGFSRPLPGVDGQPFWSVTGDADSVAFFIKDWLKKHGRESSPRFLCGESYGTARAAQIIGTHRDLKFDGVLLVSMMGGMENPDLSLVVEFPTYAAAAAFHGKVDSAGRTPEQIFNEAVTFARNEYLPALVQGTALPREEKARIAGEMAKRLGLPEAYLVAKDLRLEPLDFMLSVIADRGLRTGQIDSRVTGKLEEFAGQTPPGDDPSMSSSKAAPGSARPKPAAKSATQVYFNEELKYPDTEKYNALNLVINGKWIFDVDRPLKDPAGLIGEVMREQPQLRLFWAAGYYDITTPLYAGKYTLEHSGAPADRLTIAAYPTGHMVYEGDQNLDRFVKSVVKFAKGGPAQEAAAKTPIA
ncbi:MAG: S10 family serine carboxypeptidase-like protein, partial [Candidatus Aminicenantales bacterium]